MSADIFQADLLEDECVLWTGQPNPNPHPSQDNYALIIPKIIGFFLCGVSVIIFIVTGGDAILLSMIFFIAGWFVGVKRPAQHLYEKQNTYYAITNQRLLTVVSTDLKKIMLETPLGAIFSINKIIYPDGSGCLTFITSTLLNMETHTTHDHGRTFANIPDAEKVYRLASNLLYP